MMCASAVGGASACDEAACTTAAQTFIQGLTTTCNDDDNDATTCPDGCQGLIDDYYGDCGGCPGFDETTAPTTKTQVEAMGCGGAADTAPALFIALAAAANHFLQ